jgi:hypothetical protein
MMKECEKFKEEGYCIEKMTKVPLIMNAYGLVISAQTDLGQKKFLLDTGFTTNVIRSSLLDRQLFQDEKPEEMFVTSKFLIGERDFGKQEFCPLDIAEAFDDLDGFLGMPFFQNHAVLLGFQNHLAYITQSRCKK